MSDIKNYERAHDVAQVLRFADSEADWRAVHTATLNALNDADSRSALYMVKRIVELEADYKLLESNAYELQGDCRDQQAQIEKLQAEVKLDDQLIEDRNRLLNLSGLECDAHGQGCIPGAIENVAKLQAELAKPPATRAADQLLKLGQEVDTLRAEVKRLGEALNSTVESHDRQDVVVANLREQVPDSCNHGREDGTCLECSLAGPGTETR